MQLDINRFLCGAEEEEEEEEQNDGCGGNYMKLTSCVL